MLCTLFFSSYPLHMKHRYTGRLLLAILLFWSTPHPMLAQSRHPLWGLSAGGGINFSYTDVKPSVITAEGSAAFLLQPLTSLQFSLGLHVGSLKAMTDNPSGAMNFSTTYFAPTLVARFFPAALVPNKEKDLFIDIASHLFIGAGLAVLNSTVSSQRLWRPDYGSYGDYVKSDLAYLAEIGYQYPLLTTARQRQLSVMVHYRFNFAQFDQADGYMPLPAGTSDNDAYNTLGATILWQW